MLSLLSSAVVAWDPFANQNGSLQVRLLPSTPVDVLVAEMADAPVIRLPVRGTVDFPTREHE